MCESSGFAGFSKLVTASADLPGKVIVTVSQTLSLEETMVRTIFSRRRFGTTRFATERNCQMESLESRTYLSITPLPPPHMFAPIYGAETVQNGGAAVLKNIAVSFIFWGSSWQNATNPSAAEIQSAAGSFLYGPYLSGLQQYGSDGKAHLAGAVFNSSQPAQGFSQDDLQNIISSEIDQGAISPFNLVMVITPAGIQSNNPDAGGYHSAYEHDLGSGSITVRHGVDFGWISGGDIGHDTEVMSHEVVEAITDPGASGGITTTHGASWTGGGDFEIADAEAQDHTYVLNGVEVQSYWSKADKAYIVPVGPPGQDPDQTPVVRPPAKIS